MAGKFFFQLKAITGSGWHDSTLIYTGYVEADDKKSAKAKMDDEFQMKLKERVIAKKGQKPPEYKLYLVPADPGVEEFYLTARKCLTCGDSYTILEHRNLGHYASKEVCSTECRAHNRPKLPEYFDSTDGYQKPVIYRITNKQNGQCYIGKTKQPFTLRWWQHFFHPTDTKFHKAILETKISDWTFEIMETMESNATDSEIAEKEQFFIDKFDSLLNGYNSTSASKMAKELPLFGGENVG